MTTKRVIETLHDRVHTSAASVRGRIGIVPKVGLILGSGLGGYGDKLERAKKIPYSDIPYFPQSHVVGHKGCLAVGERNGVPCVASTPFNS